MTTQAPHAPWSVDSTEFPLAGSGAEKLIFLLRYAILAPSGHNTQPWQFSVDDDSVELYADRRQALPVVDPDDRELTISCGAALLNLRVALRRFGYRDDAYELLPEPTEPDLLARLRLIPGEPVSADAETLCEAIPARCTTRAAYDGVGVPIDVQHALAAEAMCEGAWLHLVSDTERPEITQLVAEGDRTQMRDKRFRHELAAWTHPNRSRARRGLRGYGFGLGDLQSLGTPLVIRTFDLGNSQAAKDRELVDHSPLVTVLGTEGDSPRDWLIAGQAMERALLRACAHGLTASYLNQPVEVKALRPQLASTIGRNGEYPQLVMRFGYGPETTHSPRTPVEEVIRERSNQPPASRVGPTPWPQ